MVPSHLCFFLRDSEVSSKGIKWYGLQNQAGGFADWMHYPKKVSKIELYEALISTSKNTEWGFDIERLPNKQFMLDIIHHLRPDDPLFSFRAADQDNSALIEFPLDLFKQVNTKVIPFGISAPLFKKQEEQRERERIAKLQKRVANKERRAQILELEIEKARKSAQDIQNLIQQDSD